MEVKSQQSPGIKPRTPDLGCQCSATELQKLDKQLSQSSICTALVVLKCPSDCQVCDWGIRLIVNDYKWSELLLNSKFSVKSMTGQYLTLGMSIEMVAQHSLIKLFE